MPVDHRISGDKILYQRDIYAKSALTRRFRDYLDSIALGALKGRPCVLDIGCGEGILLEKIGQFCSDVSAQGIDLCRENIEICRSHKLSAFLADACKLPFADGVFDACVMTEVIEHLEDGQAQCVIGEAYRVLSKGGIIIVMFPKDRNYRIARLLTCKFREAFYDMGHERQWTPEAAERCIRGASFTIKRSFSVPVNFWPLALNHIVIGIKG